jgi:PhnB protein
MRFLQLVMPAGAPVGPPSAEHIANVRRAIQESIDAGRLIATGAVGKRATAAARVVKKDGVISVEDPPDEAAWMAAGGYSIIQLDSKEEAIENARRTLSHMGDAAVELIQVSEMHPPPALPTTSEGKPAHPLGVVPYLTMVDTAAASTFYQAAFGAREVVRMPSSDGKRLMHCRLEINGGSLMLSDRSPEMADPEVARSASYTMQLMVTDGDAWWRRAVRAGCKEKVPFARAPWGDRYGQLEDPFGVLWAIDEPPVAVPGAR